MPKIINTVLIVAAIFMFTACGGSSRSNYHLVKHHEPRQSSLGFSVKPPPGNGWYETLKKDSLVYLKISKATAHSYSILTKAREVKLPRKFGGPDSFLSYVQNNKDAGLKKENYRNIETDYEVDNSISDFCVRYKQGYEDHGLDVLRNRRHVNVTATGIFCRHPENPDVAVDVSYLEKSVSGVKTQSYKKEGEIFLSSLSFYKGG